MRLRVQKAFSRQRIVGFLVGAWVFGCATGPHSAVGADESLTTVASNEEAIWLRRALGSYEGHWGFKPGQRYPLTTSFDIDKEGRLAGSYRYADPLGRILNGKIEACRILAPGRLACRWSQPGSSGDFALEFAPDYSRFEAIWSFDGDTTSHPWDGERKEPPVSA